MVSPVTRATLDRPAAEALSEQWWMLLLAGIFSSVVGIIILSVNWTLADLALVVSLFFVVNGTFVPPRHRSTTRAEGGTSVSASSRSSSGSQSSPGPA